MCKVMENMENKTFIINYKIEVLHTKIKDTVRLLMEGILSVEQIACVVELPVEEVEKIQAYFEL